MQCRKMLKSFIVVEVCDGEVQIPSMVDIVS